MAELNRASEKLYEVVGGQSPHRRGDFATSRWGFAYGLGRKVSSGPILPPQITRS